MIFRIVSSNTSSPASIKPCHSRQLPKRLPLRPVLILILNVPETLERLSEDLYTLYNFNILCLEHLLKELIFLSFQETSSKSSIIFHHISGGFFFFLFRQYLGHGILTFLKEATHLFPLLKNIKKCVG